MSYPFTSLDALAAQIPDGALLGVPKESSGVAMAATRALIRRGLRGLHLLCLPAAGLQADLLIGAGCAATVEAGAITMGEFGYAPRFRDGVQSGTLKMRDSTCPAIYAALQAAEKGVPFMPLRGMIGSDVLNNRPDWKVEQNPFADAPDPIALLPAIKPDVALFHARYGDRYGNVWVGNHRECVILAHASTTSLVTVEEIYDGNLMEDPNRVAGTIPPLYLGAVALAPEGAKPIGYPGLYGPDREHLRRYVEMAKTRDGFDAYLGEFVYGESIAA